MSKENCNYFEKEITFEIDDITLAGTLVTPNTEQFPCAVLLSGYGSITRNNPSKNFPRYKVLAEELMRNGIASLRFDDRGSGHSSKVNWHDFTFDNLADEALAAAKFVREVPEVNPEKIGFVGHSLGAAIGPLAAVKSNDIAFVSSSGSHGLIGIETAINSRNALAKSFGESDEEITSWSEKLREILKDLRDKKANKNPISTLKQLLQEKYEQLPSELRENFPTIELYLQSSYEGILIQIGDTPMYRSFLAFDPKEMYKQLKCPIQFIFAGRDVMHPPEFHKKAILEVFDTSKIDVTVIDFLDANHDFTIIENQVATGFVTGFSDSIFDWIRNL